jgi:hypothetical protein
MSAGSHCPAPLACRARPIATRRQALPFLEPLPDRGYKSTPIPFSVFDHRKAPPPPFLLPPSPSMVKQAHIPPLLPLNSFRLRQSWPRPQPSCAEICAARPPEHHLSVSTATVGPMRWVPRAPPPQNGILGPPSRSWHGRPAPSSPAALAQPGHRLCPACPAPRPARAGEEARASGMSQATWPMSGRPVG